MTRAELLELLTVERFAPMPRARPRRRIPITPTALDDPAVIVERRRQLLLEVDGRPLLEVPTLHERTA